MRAATVHVNGVDVENVTGKPDDAAALAVIGDSVNILSPIVSNVIV